jgi:DNA-binding winged helix-turn-helix (wHTH) protein/tetratricopeptide (TPR) repeat protein/TolB-like protein
MERPVQLPKIFRFGLFEADVGRNVLTREGLRVKIQDQPFRVLILLLERPGDIVTREELRQQLWQEGTFVDFDGSLNVILKKLRAALGDDPENPRFIETIPKRGYRFIAPVSLASDMRKTTTPQVVADNLADAAGTTPGTSAPETRRRSYLLYISAAVTLAISVFVTWAILRNHGSVAVAPNRGAPASVRTVMRKSVAVLGFRNTSGSVDDAWLGTALSEMLSTELAGGEKLRLVSGEDVANLRRSAPWSQSGTLDQQTTARIGTALNGDLLVQGSYATIGKQDRGQMRLDVSLQDAQTGEILTEIAEIGGRQDLFRIVSRAGAKLRDRLGVPQLEETDEATVFASLPANAEAQRLYSIGLVKLRAYDYLAARDLFQEATKADPRFPLAYSMLSRADIFLGHDDLAKAEAKRGLQLAGGLPRSQKMEIEASYYHAIADRAKAAEIYNVLFNLFPDSLQYGLQLTKLQLESYQPDAALETIRQLRRLPPPSSDDPRLDLREAFIIIRNDRPAANRLFHSAATKARSQGKRLIYAQAQESLCWTNPQHLQSPPECQEAYEAFMAAGNRDEAGSCLQLMAEAHRLTGHNQEAIPLYRQALGLLREAGDREKVGVAGNNLALILENQGRWSQAEQAFRDALENFQAVNDKANTGVALSNIADILVLRGRLREAADVYRQAWEVTDASRRGRSESDHIQYSSLLLMEGEVQHARKEIETQVDALRSNGGDPWQLANGLSVLGDIEKAQGSLDHARKNYEEAFEVLKKANSPNAGLQVSLAELAIAEGHPAAAEQSVRQAVAEFEKEQSAGDEIGGYTSLSRALLEEGKLAEARDAIAHAFNLADLHEFPALSLPLQLLHARVAAADAKPGPQGRNDLSPAYEEMRNVIHKSQQIGLYNINCEARVALLKLQWAANPAAARGQLASLAVEARGRGLELLARQADAVVATPGSAVAAK